MVKKILVVAFMLFAGNMGWANAQNAVHATPRFDIRDRIQFQKDRIQEGLADKTITPGHARYCLATLSVVENHLNHESVSNPKVDLAIVQRHGLGQLLAPGLDVVLGSNITRSGLQHPALTRSGVVEDAPHHALIVSDRNARPVVAMRIAIFLVSPFEQSKNPFTICALKCASTLARQNSCTHKKLRKVMRSSPNGLRTR